MKPQKASTEKKTIAPCEKLNVAEALKIKNRRPLDPEFIKEAFANKNIEVVTKGNTLNLNFYKRDFTNKILLMMSSGNFGDLNWNNLKNHILKF